MKWIQYIQIKINNLTWLAKGSAFLTRGAKNPDLPFATVCSLSLPSATANLHTKTLNLTHPSTDRSKFGTIPRYISEDFKTNQK